MKKPLRLIAALLAFCVAAATFPPVGLALEEFVLLVHRDEVYGSRGNKDQVELVALDQFGGDIE